MSTTLQVASIFPDGTSVGAYLADAQPAGAGPPTGPSAETAIVTGGRLTYAALTDHVGYAAIAQVGGVYRRLLFRPGVDRSTGPVLGDDARLPTEDQIAALAGTEGVPSAANKFVTDADPRLTQHTAGARIVGIGDSITAHEMRASDPSSRSANAWLWWAMMFSNGRLLDGGVSAHGGYRASEVRDNSLPEVLAMNPRPDFCTVLAGINDVLYFLQSHPAYDFSNEIKTALTGIYNELEAADGITPIACTIPAGMYYFAPDGGSPNAWNSWAPVLADINGWIRAEAITRGIPCADFESVISDPANPGVARSGLVDYDALGCHPSPAGAVIMGQYLSDLVAPLISPAIPSVPEWDSTATNQLTNGLMAGTTLPTGWTVDTAGTGVTNTCVADAAITGQWWRIQKNANDETVFIQTIASGLSVGGYVRFSGRIKFNSLPARDDVTPENNIVKMLIGDDFNQILRDRRTSNLDVIADIGGGDQPFPSSNFYWWLAPQAGVDSDGSQIRGLPLTDVEGRFVVEASLVRPALHFTISVAGIVDVQFAELMLQAFESDGTPVT